MRTVKYITLQTAENLISDYQNAGGLVFEVEPGGVGLGLVVLANGGNNSLKQFIITEYYLNEWSSGHELKIYTKDLPAKYLDLINQ